MVRIRGETPPQKAPTWRQKLNWRYWLQQFQAFNIRMKVILPYLFLTLAVAVIGVFVVTRLMAGSLEERLNTQLVQAGRVVSTGLARQELAQRETAMQIAYTEDFAEALQARDPEAIKTLAEPLAVAQGVECLIIVDAEGERMLHLLKQEGQYEVVERPFKTQDVWIIQALLDTDDPSALPLRALGEHPVDKHYYYFTALPVEGEGALIGVITIGTSLDTLLSLFKSTALADVTIYDQNGQMIDSTLIYFVDPANEEVLRSNLALSPERYVLAAAGKEITLLNDLAIEENIYRLAVGALVIGDQSLGVFSVALPMEFILATSATSRDTYIVIFMGAALFVVGLGYFVSSFITRPLGRLVESSKAIAEGDLEHRTGIERQDEIGVLAETFDQMTERLAARTNELKDLLRMQRETASRMRSILSSIGDGVLLEDMYGEIIPLNKAAEVMLQQMAEHFLFGPLRELAIPEQDGEGGLDNPWLVESRRFQVAEKVFSVHSAAVRTDEGEQLGTVIVLRDITAEVEAEQIKDAFVAHVSHELRTPLTSIKGYSALLLSTSGDALNESQRHFLETILSNTEDLIAMVNALLDFSEMEAKGHLGIRPQPLALVPLVEKVAEEWRPQMEEKGLDFTVDMDSAAPIIINGDERRLQWALTNLVRNAWQYTPDDGEVKMRLTTSNKQVVIDVIDSGPGIAPEDQHRVFTRFYRLTSVKEGEGRGLGLGLYVTKAIVEAHGGEIVVDSELGAGSTFTLKIPLAQQAVPEAERAAAQPSVEQQGG